MSILHYLHGKHPRPWVLGATVLVGIAGPLLLWPMMPEDWTLVQQLVFFLLGFDLFGGVVANHSRSTQVFWQSRSKAWQIGFLVVHGLQPLVVCLFFDWNPPLLLFGLWLFVVVVGSILLHLDAANNRIGISIGLTTGLLLWLHWAEPIWAWFGVVYLLKLLSGFCGRVAVP